MNRQPLQTPSLSTHATITPGNRLIVVDMVAQVLLAAGIGLAASLVLAGAVLLVSGAGS